MSATATSLGPLENGELRLLGLLPRASNYTFLGEVGDGESARRVVYKPREGEMPLWDFPEGTLCQREVAAYRLATGLGWPNVPATILRDGPHGEGSVQLFVEHDPAEHYFTLRERRADDLRAVAAFDVISGNGDRKSGHCLEGTDGRLWVVDHGLCFSERPVLRTVIWEYAGEPLPARLLEDVRRIESELRDGALREGLAGLLGDNEIEATAGRARQLLAEGRYPFPGPGRSEPWPPV
ncbi:MAG: SCO1664 family protein [Actinomycetota bacterium]